MLRRRRKTPKVVDNPAARGPTSRSRRRPRADAHVPPELIVPPQVEAAAVAKEVPRARPAAPVKHPQPTKPAKPAHPAKPAQPTKVAQPTNNARAPKTASQSQVVLVTGFEPFGDEARNPSWEVCERLPRMLSGLRVEIVRVPCVFREAIEVVAQAIEQHDPALVLCLGQAGGRAHLSVERIGINVDDARIADNAGARPVDEPIAANGPPAYFSTLPVKAMVAAMRAAQVPVELSNSAGTYVCNHLLYGVLHFVAASGGRARAGFIHVPYAEEQVLDKPGVAAMAIATMVRGVEAAVAAAVAYAHDIRVAEGTLD